MTTWTKINIGITAVAIGAVAWQWHQLSEANQRAADLQQQLARQTELYNQGQSALQQLQERNAALTQQAEAAAPPTAAGGGVALNSAAAKTALAAGAAGKKNLLAQMLSDPAMKKAVREQQEWMVKKQYAALTKQLKLAPEQTDKFYSILLDQQNSAMSNSMDLMAGGEKAAGAAKAVKDAETSSDSQIQTLLGDEGFAQYKDFKDGLGDKMLLDQMAADFADNPLSAEQQQQLLQTMRAARQSASPVPGQAAPQTDPADLAATMDHALQQQEEINGQVLEQAAAFLSPEQLQTLGNSQSNMMHMQKAGIAMAQSMFGGATNGNPPAP